MKAADIHLNLDTKHEAASNYTEAAQVMKRDDPKGGCGLCRRGISCNDVLTYRGCTVLLACSGDLHRYGEGGCVCVVE